MADEAKMAAAATPAASLKAAMDKIGQWESAAAPIVHHVAEHGVKGLTVDAGFWTVVAGSILAGAFGIHSGSADTAAALIGVGIAAVTTYCTTHKLQKGKILSQLMEMGQAVLTAETAQK